MRQSKIGNQWHGSEKVAGGNLTGATDTDYFYFFCPVCRDTHILQILDYRVVDEGPVEYAAKDRPKTRKDFTLAFEVYCPKCELHDYVKLSNTRWQGGELKDSPSLDYVVHAR